MKNALLPICFTLFVTSEIGLTNLPIIGQTLEFSSRASAQNVTGYVPPVSTQRTSRTKGAGSREDAMPTETVRVATIAPQV